MYDVGLGVNLRESSENERTNERTNERASEPARERKEKEKRAGRKGGKSGKEWQTETGREERVGGEEGRSRSNVTDAAQ